MNDACPIFCPFCNATGSSQSVLSLLVATFEPATTMAEDNVSPPQPSYKYRCGRCGFIELHGRLLHVK